MVLSKEDFKKKIDTLEISDDKKIEILEDIEDSWTDDDVNEEYKAERKEMEASIASLEAEAAELKAKYKERFFNTETVENKDDILEDIEEKKIIDVKEI
jgi:hypothetical protein